MRLWITLIMLSTTPAYAAVVSQGSGAQHGSGAEREVTLCLVPDIQNLASHSDLGATPSTDCSQPEGANCTIGASCTASPYCSGSWWNTGGVLLRNMAYSLTGQYSKIDYTAIQGSDFVLSRQPHALNHATCDVIIGLGDNMDTTDLRTYAQLTAAMVHEYEMALSFWSIVKASGIPYIISRGNHDGEGVFDTLITALAVESESFHHAIHSDRDQYAIKFSTATGKEFCALTLDDDDTGGDGGEAGGDYTASEAAWVLSNVGCGSDLPTILAGHEIVQSDAGATLLANASTVTNDAGSGEIFIVAGGHYTPSPALSRKVAGTTGAGGAMFKFFSNWQEVNRHNTNKGGTGLTPSDGNGGLYTVITISPADDRLCAHEWNPYFQLTTATGNGQDVGATITSNYCVDFDFDARFP